MSESVLPVVLGDIASVRAPGVHSLVHLVDDVSNLLTAQALVPPYAPAAVTACEPGYLCVDERARWARIFGMGCAAVVILIIFVMAG